MRIFIIKNVYTHRGWWQCTVAMAKWSFVHTFFFALKSSIYSYWKIVFSLLIRIFCVLKMRIFYIFLKNWFAGFWLVVFYREDQSSFDPLPSIFLFNKKKKGWNLNTPLLNWFFLFFSWIYSSGWKCCIRPMGLNRLWCCAAGESGLAKCLINNWRLWWMSVSQWKRRMLTRNHDTMYWWILRENSKWDFKREQKLNFKRK